MTPNIETRHVTERPEFRSLDGGRTLIAHGYAAVYNVLSRDLGGFREQVLPSAFTKTLQEADVRAYQDHNHALFLGRTSSGTLQLRSDDHGLYYEVTLPDTTAGRDAAALLERGDMVGSSFGFTTHRGSQRTEVDDDGNSIRSLIDVGLHHVSPLTETPAYDEATTALAMRSLAASHNLDLDRLLQAAASNSLADMLQERSADDNETDNDDTEETEPTGPGKTHPVRVRRYRRYS